MIYLQKITDISCMHIYFLYLSLNHVNAIINNHCYTAPSFPYHQLSTILLGGCQVALPPFRVVNTLEVSGAVYALHAFQGRLLGAVSRRFFFDFFWGGSLGLLPGNAKKKFSKGEIWPEIEVLVGEIHVFLNFHPAKLGKIPILTNMFQRGRRSTTN